MAEPVIQASAWEDMAAIADAYLASAGPAAARRVTDRLLDAIDLLADMPQLAPLHHDPVLAAKGYRKLVVDRHVCVYRVDDGVPIVLRVFHGAGDYPGRLG